MEKEIPQYSIVRVKQSYISRLRVSGNKNHDLLKSSFFIYLGEIPNMPGHCVVADYGNKGRILSGFHTEDFEVVPLEDL
jgi:hypothetical protein